MDKRLRNYFIGVMWFVLSLFSSSINDVIAKYSGMRLHSYEITFFRFLFGTITLMPFIMYYGISTLKTEKYIIHIIRGLLLFVGISGWTYGLTLVQVTTATVVNFTIPIFILILGVIILGEKAPWQRWCITIVAFTGLFINLSPSSDTFNPEVLIFVLSAIIFAVLDIINKKVVVQESMISMLFYSAIITALLSFPFAIQYWVTPTMNELFLLFVLGGSANLILFFLLKAFASTDITALAPYRYFELVASTVISYIIFEELPTDDTLLGALIIIPSTLFIIYSEKNVLTKNLDR